MILMNNSALYFNLYQFYINFHLDTNQKHLLRFSCRTYSMPRFTAFSCLCYCIVHLEKERCHILANLFNT